MSFSQSVGDLDGELERLVQSHPLAWDTLIQRLAGNVLHHDKVNAALVPDIVNRNDVGMVQRGCGFRFLNKASLAVRIAHLVSRQDLDRYGSVQPDIASFVNNTHPSCP